MSDKPKLMPLGPELRARLNKADCPLAGIITEIANRHDVITIILGETLDALVELREKKTDETEETRLESRLLLLAETIQNMTDVLVKQQLG
jgi:hypothetical protein